MTIKKCNEIKIQKLIIINYKSCITKELAKPTISSFLMLITITKPKKVKH